MVKYEMLEQADVIIVGAGAAGLLAAVRLSESGQTVLMLEARRRIGGRVFSYKNGKFPFPLEGGAEFIHGHPAVTNSLLRRYRIKKFAVKGRVMHMRHGRPEKDDKLVNEHHSLLEKKLKSLKCDLPLQQFIDRYFRGPQFSALRLSIRGFVEGYESGEMESFSTMAFRDDWLDAESWENQRIEGGYGALLNAITRDAKANGCIIHFLQKVTHITWKHHTVSVKCSSGKTYHSKKVLITVPLGVLQKNQLRFSPSLPGKRDAWNEMGFGNVIKIQLLFANKWWEEKEVEKRTGEKMKKLFFFFSHAAVPTWWTQTPKDVPLLTGWLSGPAAKDKCKLSEKRLQNEAIKSLAYIFNSPVEEIANHLVAAKTFNWVADQFVIGGYSYLTPGHDKLRKQAAASIENTIFFAGEHLAEPVGTVESAFVSAMNAVDLIIK